MNLEESTSATEKHKVDAAASSFDWSSATPQEITAHAELVRQSFQEKNPKLTTIDALQKVAKIIPSKLPEEVGQNLLDSASNSGAHARSQENKDINQAIITLSLRTIFHYL